LAISVSQELYDFGRISARMVAADARAAAAGAEREVALLDVQLAVEEAYNAVLAARDVLHATEEALRRAVTHRDFAVAGTTSGMRPPIELTRAQADVAQLEVRRIRARAGLDAAQAAFAAAMGSTALAVDAQPSGEVESPSPSLEQVMERAARKNPAIAAARSRLDAERASTRAIGRELLPNLSATAGLSGRAGGAATATAAPPFGDGWLPDVPNWHLGVVLSWNLFDATVLARRSASQARERVAQADLEATRLAVALGAERAHLELDAALGALPGLRASVEAARRNQAQADARFRAGLGTVVELADAEALLTTAELELAVGRFAVARARAELGRALAEVKS
jgi:outer membrane protein